MASLPVQRLRTYQEKTRREFLDIVAKCEGSVQRAENGEEYFITSTGQRHKLVNAAADDRYRKCAAWLAGVRAGKNGEQQVFPDFEDRPIGLTLEQFLNAGAHSGGFITISYGIYWFQAFDILVDVLIHAIRESPKTAAEPTSMLAAFLVERSIFSMSGPQTLFRYRAETGKRVIDLPSWAMAAFDRQNADPAYSTEHLDAAETFIILHEHGHFALGHFDRNALLSTRERELQADQFATALVGKMMHKKPQVLVRGFTRLFGLMDLGSPYHHDDPLLANQYPSALARLRACMKTLGHPDPDRVCQAVADLNQGIRGLNNDYQRR